MVHGLEIIKRLNEEACRKPTEQPCEKVAELPSKAQIMWTWFVDCYFAAIGATEYPTDE